MKELYNHNWHKNLFFENDKRLIIDIAETKQYEPVVNRMEN
jgi:hypothetical protein